MGSVFECGARKYEQTLAMCLALQVTANNVCILITLFILLTRQ
jgi:hypothetical protein